MRLPWGLFPYRDITMWSPLFGGIPTFRLSFALSVSHALDELLLHSVCGSISPHSHVRDSLFRGFSRCQANTTHCCAVPSCRFTTFASSQVAPTVQLESSQLQGLNPGSDSSRRAGGLDLLTTRSPLEFSLPRASLRTPW
jgi:hypothetical protein